MYRTLQIYLAGAMKGQSYEKMNKWRIDIKRKIKEASYYTEAAVRVINPVDYFNYDNDKHFTEEEVRDFDLSLATSSDIIITNLEGLDSSIGTIIELHDCHYHKKIPVIAFGDNGIIDTLHPWIDLNITRYEETMDDVVDYVKEFYMK